MKKKIAILLAALSAAAVLTACGGADLEGRYVCVEENPRIELGLTELTFTEDAVTGVQYGAFSFDEMNWEVKDGKLILSETLLYTEGLETGEEDFVYEYAFEAKGDSIFLDGVEFKKK
ncbi:MAG: hypothetical protein E7638_06195 [Ruminococcaceae bacterium]|nr:hypothetical protein [Oscillospiraceae bacterium]